MIRSTALLGVAIVTACSSLPDAGGGIVDLEIRAPDSLCTAATACTLVAGDSLTFRARALNLQGDSVAADILWSTPDTLLITLDTLRGAVIARSDSTGVAHVQARTGTLRSDVISITVQRDTTTAAGLRGRP
ncbi:MAG: hypothetical protein ACRELE_07640 [Gemmatimonadales bacterium]